MRDFSAATLRALARKGIALVGLQAIPDASGSFLAAERGYRVNDNGCARVLTFAEMKEAAR